MVKNIKIITPSEHGGVLDYSININNALIKKGFNSSIKKINKFNKKKITIKRGENVILQMSGYGFQEKGIPFWLVRQVKEIKKLTSSFGIYFHEISINYKISKPQSIIIMLLQNYILICLLRYCNYFITSNSVYEKWLKKNSLNIKNYLAPTISNINLNLKNIKKDKSIVVIFGTSPTRINIYQNHFDILKRWISENNLFLCDVGPKIKDKRINDLIKGNPNIKIYGKLSSKSIQNLFSRAYLGIFSLPDNLINKSGTFATYCKFKICPINLKDFDIKNKKKINKRFLNFLPNNNVYNYQISNINKYNFKFSIKNNIRSHMEIYLKNIK